MSPTSEYGQITTRHLMARARPFSRLVFRVTEHLIMKKTTWNLEQAANIQYIAKWTKIPVPELVRVHASDDTLSMSIEGTEFEDLWPTMTPQTRHHRQ